MLHFWCYSSHNESTLQYVQDGKLLLSPPRSTFLLLSVVVHSEVIEFESCTIRLGKYYDSKLEPGVLLEISSRACFPCFPLPPPPLPISTQLPLNTSNRDPQIECNFRRRFSGIFKLLQFFIPMQETLKLPEESGEI